MNILPVANLDLYSIILKVGGLEPPIDEVDVISPGVAWMGIPVPAILDCMKPEGKIEHINYGIGPHFQLGQLICSFLHGSRC